MIHLKKMTPKQTDPQFKLRMTPEIKSAIEAASALSGRSMNAEILFRLEQSFREDEPVTISRSTEEIILAALELYERRNKATKPD